MYNHNVLHSSLHQYITHTKDTNVQCIICTMPSIGVHHITLYVLYTGVGYCVARYGYTWL